MSSSSSSLPMRWVARSLLRSPDHRASSPRPELSPTFSEMVVILVALLCAMLSIAGLASIVSHCASRLRSFSSSSHPGGEGLPQTNKGLKKKALRALPKVAYGAGGGGLTECPICLAEFEEGEELRVLPQCGHLFHVRCVDLWLGSRSSCPSCRRVLVVVVPPSR